MPACSESSEGAIDAARPGRIVEGLKRLKGLSPISTRG